MKDESMNIAGRAPGFRPRLALYHANPRGTGCAISMELHPAHDEMDGSICCTFASQKTVGNRAGKVPTYPSFDWDDPIRVALCFDDLSKMMQVFRGECESIDRDQGILHRTTKGITRIQLRHIIDPMSGYSFEATFKPADGGDEMRAVFLMSSAEALGICEAIGGCMYLVAFGVPRVFAPRELKA